MKVTNIILPLMLVLLLGGFSLSLAASPSGEAAPVDEHVADNVKAGHGLLVSSAHAATDGQEAHGADDGHGAGKSITPEKLKDLFWRTVNFIALLVLLIYFLAKPIGNALAGRQQQVIDELETLQAKRDAAERSYKEFESRLAGMEKEMEVVVARAIKQAENEKVKILEDAEKAAEDIKRQAEAAVQAEIVEAKRKLRDEIADQAALLAEELIVKNLTPADQVKITEQYLDRVGAVQ
ncbi:MAG: ATP synthase F0 subunit B [Desulfobulbaceae bacterium]|nr:ATP synthase F0 subunit B [Desulfobulbaceae bacterium]